MNNEMSFEERCRVTKEAIINKKDLLKFINKILFDRSIQYKKTLFFADLNIKSNSNENALFSSNPVMTKYLIKKGVDVNNINNTGENALFTAQSIEKTKILIEAGINKNQLNFRGENALFSCSMDEKLEYLIDQGLNIHHKDISGRTCLFCYNDINKINLLLDAGANINIKDNEGKTILESFSFDVCIYLIEKGIDLSHYSSNESDLNKIFSDSYKKDLVPIILEHKIRKEQEILNMTLSYPNLFNKSSKPRI